MKDTSINYSQAWQRLVSHITFYSLGLMVGLSLASIVWAEGVTTPADQEGPAQTAYVPASGQGPIVMLISGQTGPTAYHSYAIEIAKLGYYAVLLEGKDILNPEHTGEANLKMAIERAQRSPHAMKGKAAVIGFSLGGGGALYNAAHLPNLVSMVIAYYPYNKSWANKMTVLVNRFQVPILVLAGEQDRHKECCMIETMRAMEEQAKVSGAKFELVAYKNADHGFNLQTSAKGEPTNAYRSNDSSDAWQRTMEMLKVYQPLQKDS